ncbi:hypothetical protein GCM10010472_19810 [Pseudonocardia halophobica]|uniref:CHK kinase-like domain-containing protein n=1 Tax=Pseudonocardia halophobica TaxID=29401 RepID=A0A9W6NTZ8_9PSEU|nr:phosphotransferase [Pseudonocardia halophobica]GLL09805.1 hypothetical protein GCM10017577_09450 [Pseudonocardia halophobica]
MSASTTVIATAADITPAWLTQVLGDSPRITGDARVADVVATRIGTGQLGTTYLLEVTYADGGVGKPARMVAKLPALDPANRALAASLACYSREVAFYSNLAGTLPIRTPECYHASVSADGQDFCLLLEDLTPAAEVTQVEGCDLAHARAALEQAAALHAGSWRDPALAEQEWLLSALPVWQQMSAALPQAQVAFRERYAGLLDDTTIEVAESVAGGAAARWVEQLTEPRCLWHSDFRLDNLLFDASGGRVPVAVVDWQSVALASGPVDASYFIGAGLPTEVRREHEEELLRGYHDALVRGGVTDYSWEQCLAEYRVNSLAGFVISVVVSIGTERSPEGDALFTTMAARHAAHIKDCGAVALLEG